ASLPLQSLAGDTPATTDHQSTFATRGTREVFSRVPAQLFSSCSYGRGGGVGYGLGVGLGLGGTVGVDVGVAVGVCVAVAVAVAVAVGVPHGTPRLVRRCTTARNWKVCPTMPPTLQICPAP